MNGDKTTNKSIIKFCIKNLNPICENIIKINPTKKIKLL